MTRPIERMPATHTLRGGEAMYWHFFCLSEDPAPAIGGTSVKTLVLH